MRTPFGQRDEDKERVSVLTILSNLESILHNLDGLNNKIAGIVSPPHFIPKSLPPPLLVSCQPASLPAPPFHWCVLLVSPHRPKSRRDDVPGRQWKWRGSLSRTSAPHTQWYGGYELDARFYFLTRRCHGACSRLERVTNPDQICLIQSL